MQLINGGDQMAVKITLQFDDYHTSFVVPGTLEEAQATGHERLLELLSRSKDVTSLEAGRRFEAVLRDRRGNHLVYRGLTLFIGQDLVTKMTFVKQDQDSSPKQVKAVVKLRKQQPRAKPHSSHGTEQLDLLSITGD